MLRQAKCKVGREYVTIQLPKKEFRTKLGKKLYYTLSGGVIQLTTKQPLTIPVINMDKSSWIQND